MEEIEIWKDVKGYEGLYQVSNLGNVKSLNYRQTGISKLFVLNKDTVGYFTVTLSNNGKQKTHKVHKLVAIAFLNHKPDGYNLVVNHKDFNRLNNIMDNLEIVTSRENTNQIHRKSFSKYVGVNFNKRDGKWISRIVINGARKHLGCFVNEYDAHLAYQKALSELK